jgi:hypothetical protein
MALHHEQGHGQQHGLMPDVHLLEMLLNRGAVLKKDNVEKVGEAFLVLENPVHAFVNIHANPYGFAIIHLTDDVDPG